ncbi:hypothetical protein [Leclercia sp.]|uniref:hypothetical protein n=1 Tax=Leclercia sp. TaxID=1898428 RepID=UPI0028A23107|nr:hypothetical protein [Leclercia sp.]
MEQGIISLVFNTLLLSVIGCMAWLYTNHNNLKNIKPLKRLVKIKRALVIYSRYIYSGGNFRRTLFVLVVISLTFVVLFDSSRYKFLENMAFSVIAAYIFDTFLNFQKEHLSKCMVSRHWHSSYYSCYDREKVLLALFLGGRAQPKNLSIEKLHGVLYKCLIKRQHFVTSKSIHMVWSSDGNGLKMIDLPIGNDIHSIVLAFIKEDAAFIHAFYHDDKVTSSFPAMNGISQRFNNSCVRTLSMVETRLGLQNGWRGSDEIIHEHIRIYLSHRRIFMARCEMHMASYGVLGF